jgi:protoheme IX farnesyltransferase
MSSAAASSRLRPLMTDLVTLTKPRVTSLVVATAAAGMGLAPGSLSLPSALCALLATGMLVGSANAFNSWVERDTDGLMARTSRRPLPARRLEPQLAFGFATALAVISLPVLTLGINPMTGLLGTLALWSYVWVYTPLKYRSPSALVVGAVPGALPPLMGWTAVTGRIDVGGLWLFAILFLWQMPHVIGLSIYRCQDYASAGVQVLPLVRGSRVAQRHAIAWAALLLPISLGAGRLGLGGPVYTAFAALLGIAYLGSTLYAWFRPEERPETWGRRVFLISLLYLPLLLSVLLLDQVG